MKHHFFCILCILAVVAIAASAHGDTTRPKAGSISPRLREATVLEPENPKTQHRVVVGLDLRNRGELDSLLADMQNPNSPRYRRFLTPEEFNSRYAPSADTEQRVVDYLQANGLSVTGRFPNRLLVAAAGSVRALNRAFGVELRRVSFRGMPRFAAINEPSLPDDIAGHVVGVMGLDNLSVMHPHLRRFQPAAAPRAAVGSSCCSFSPNDLKTLYNNGGSYDGSGETVVIAGAFAWSDNDVDTFNTHWGLASLAAGSGQVCTGALTDPGCQIDFSSADQSSEITFDVESVHGTAPGATVLNYMAASTSSADFMTMYEQIVTDNPGHIVTTSWGSCEAGSSAAEQRADDNIFASANALG
jgi:subtilase family serine protease